MTRLAGKTILITGGAGGIGAAMARHFAAEGARIIVADVVQAAADAVAAELAEAGHGARAVQLDVSDPAAWAAAVSALADEGGLHGLVNNAAIQDRTGVMDTAPERWRRILDVNLSGAVFGIQAAAPVIRDSGGGAILNMSSTAGLIAHPAAAYSASKWALRGLTRCAAVELAPWGIRVNALLPGRIRTAFNTGADPADMEASALIVPMGRLGSADEVAAVAVMLMSDEASYVTGIDLPVDGGIASGGVLTARRTLAGMIAGRLADD